MSKVEENLEFPPQRAYFIASLILVNKKGEILLVKERNTDFWLTPGGEINYQKKEQFLQGALRETAEEIGIKLYETPELIDLMIVYPEDDNPYRDRNISMVIANYIIQFPIGKKIELSRSSDPVERKYDVKKYFWVDPLEIINKKIKMPNYFINTVVPKINSWIKKHEKE